MKMFMKYVCMALLIASSSAFCSDAAATGAAASTAESISLLDKVDMCGLLLEYIMVMEPITGSTLSRDSMLRLWQLAVDGEEDADLSKIVAYVGAQQFTPLFGAAGLGGSMLTVDWKERAAVAKKVKVQLACYFRKSLTGRASAIEEAVIARLENYTQLFEENSIPGRIFFLRTQPYPDRGALSECLRMYASVCQNAISFLDPVKYIALCLWLIASNSPASCLAGDRAKTIKTIQMHLSQVFCDLPLMSSSQHFFMSGFWIGAREALFETDLLDGALFEARELIEKRKNIADFVPTVTRFYRDKSLCSLLEKDALPVSLGTVIGKPFERPHGKRYKHWSAAEKQALRAREAARLCAQKEFAKRFLEIVLPTFRLYCSRRISGYVQNPAWDDAGAGATA